MKLYHKDNHVQNFNMHCLDGMAGLEPGSVQCVVTSPPYWGLRKYAGEQDLVWGNGHCEHEWVGAGAKRAHPDRSTGDHDAKGNGIFVDHIARGEQAAKAARGMPLEFGWGCSLCGAWKGAYGLEATPEMYVQHTVEILREVRRVLRKDGVVFWNIGDGYANDGKWGGATGGKHAAALHGDTGIGRRETNTGYKPKNLFLIPFRVAIAAQEDGWWVRSVIIWSKPNVMPESVKDRPTESHEYILMLTKSARYYWDADAVREPQSTNAHSRGTQPGGRAAAAGPKSSARGDDGISAWLQTEANQWTADGSRNLRSVWEFPTQPYRESHFAVFPEALPERCIKAATSEKGNCSKCGRPWVRIVETERTFQSGSGKAGNKPDGKRGDTEECRGFLEDDIRAGPCTSTKTVGWKPQCSCSADPVPAVVLDPFSGAGTTLWVAKKLGRRAIGFDVSEEYCELALDRNRQAAMQLV